MTMLGIWDQDVGNLGAQETRKMRILQTMTSGGLGPKNEVVGSFRLCGLPQPNPRPPSKTVAACARDMECILDRPRRLGLICSCSVLDAGQEYEEENS